MYDTTLGTRVLHGAEARLFAHSVWTLTNDLRNFVSDSGGRSVNHLIGIPVLDALTAGQVIVLIDRVSACLLDSAVAAPERTAVLDAAIAAVFQQIALDVESEIEMQSDSNQAEDNDTMIRTRVAQASAQTSGPQGSVLDTPDPECTVMDTWQFVIDQLCDRVLPDADWQLEPVAMDVEPRHGSAAKRKLGIDEDYFIDVVADVSVEDAAAAWCDLMERISGWRPEKWRFGGGLQQPDDAGPAPKMDVLPFTDHERADTQADESEPDFQQAKPVLLNDVIFEMEGAIEEWSSYVDRKNGEVVGLPSDTVSYVENGEDPDDYIGERGEEYLDLARRICHSDDFVPLPSEHDIHEWSIMRDFCDTVDSDADRQELLESVHGSGAFRFFKSTIDRLGILYEWRCYKDEAIERIVIKWLEKNSIQWSRNEPDKTNDLDEAPF